MNTTPASPRDARNILRAFLRDCGWRGDAEAAVLAMSEIATNAFLHAGGIGEVTAEISGEILRVTTEDASTDAPLPRSPAGESTSGRGLPIISELVDTWGVDPSPRGKAVWFEMRSVQL